MGVDSHIVGSIPHSQTGERIHSTLRPGWWGWLERKLAHIFDAGLVRLYPSRQQRVFSSGFVGKSLRRCSGVIDADIVNLHWIAKGPLSFRSIRRLGKPTVWTLRDMWPFTGGCHYAMECQQYQEACGTCPQLGSKREHDLSRLVWRSKRRWLNPEICFVGISEWLSTAARCSGLLEEADVRTINNCVDTDVFFPVDKMTARESLKLPQDKSILLYVADRLDDFYKGFDLFCKAVAGLDQERTLVVLVGRSEDIDLSIFPSDVRDLGYLHEDEHLRLAYSAADVFVAPSRQEAFGKTLVEAMACGTPVVCFDATGPGEIIEHKVCGYKATAFDANDMMAGMRWVLYSSESKTLEKECLRRVERLYAKEEVAKRYIALYREVLDETG